MTVQEMQLKSVEYMVSRKGLNTYTNSSDRKYFFGKPDNIIGNTTQKGYSDCSSAVRKAIQAASGIDIGSNTDAQLKNRAKGIIVHETNTYYPDLSLLLPGDCLYFKGNEYHTLDVGHVEMYIGNGKLAGHGSGTGPKIRDAMDYCKSRANADKRYFMTVRWIHDGTYEPRDTLKRGNVGADVQKMQADLILLGYDLGVYGADGDFGSATEKAVKAFQADNGLPVTGIADPVTLKKIDELLENVPEEEATPEDKPAEPAPGVTVTTGTWNIRSGPGTNYKSVGTVRGGTVLEVADLTGWIPVKYKGEVRFISTSGVEEHDG